MPSVIKSSFYQETAEKYKIEVNDNIEQLISDDKDPEHDEVVQAKTRAEFIESESKKNAQIVIDMAKKKAFNIIEDAKKDALVASQTLVKQSTDQGYILGKDNGYKDGYKVGYEEAKIKLSNKMEDLISQFTETLESLKKVKNEFIYNEEKELTSLAVTVAEDVLGEEMKDSSILVRYLAYCLNQYKNEDSVKLYVSKEFVQKLDELDPKFINNLSEIVPIEDVVTSRNMAVSDIYIETKTKIVDCSINSRIEKVKHLIC